MSCVRTECAGDNQTQLATDWKGLCWQFIGGIDHGRKRMFNVSAIQLLSRHLLKFSSDGHVRTNLCQSGNHCSTFYGDFLSVWSEGTDQDPKNVALHLSDIQGESKKDFRDQKRSSNIYGWTSQKFMGQKFHLFLDRHCLPLVACRFTQPLFLILRSTPLKDKT